MHSFTEKKWNFLFTIKQGIMKMSHLQNTILTTCMAKTVAWGEGISMEKRENVNVTIKQEFHLVLKKIALEIQIQEKKKE